MQHQQDHNDESWLEEEYHREISAQNDILERECQRQRDLTVSSTWGAFQDSATAVAQLYRERVANNYQDSGSLWMPFQTAAGTVTTLYKEACEGVRRTSDVAIQCGYQRRSLELSNWARSKKRRFIRREDLLAFLAGKPLPPSSHSTRRSPKPDHSSSHSTIHPHPINSPSGHNLPATNEQGTDLHTFKEALILRSRGPELFTFVANEIARHCKRPASSNDDEMDVCHYGNKRQRFM